MGIDDDSEGRLSVISDHHFEGDAYTREPTPPFSLEDISPPPPPWQPLVASASEHTLREQLESVVTVSITSHKRIMMMLAECQNSADRVLAQAAQAPTDGHCLRRKLNTPGASLDRSSEDLRNIGTGDATFERAPPFDGGTYPSPPQVSSNRSPEFLQSVRRPAGVAYPAASYSHEVLVEKVPCASVGVGNRSIMSHFDDMNSVEHPIAARGTHLHALAVQPKITQSKDDNVLTNHVTPRQCIPGSVNVERSFIDDVGPTRIFAKARSNFSKSNSMSMVARKTSRRGAFGDIEAMKKQLREALCKQPYNVQDYYWESGFWQAIARSIWFENTTLAIIFVNAIWFAIDSDHNKSRVLSMAHPVFQIAEHLFCCFYVCEIGVRFMAFEEKKKCLLDGWFGFDACLVLFMVLETWVMEAVYLIIGIRGKDTISNSSILRLTRLLRLSRIARMARLIRSCPELMVLLTGMAVALRSVCCTLMMVFVLIYIFALVFVEVSADTEVGELFFGSVWHSMGTLLLGSTLPDHQDIVNQVSAGGVQGFIVGTLFLVFTLLGSLTLMNMLIGVLVEVVGAVAAVEKEAAVMNHVQTRIRTLLDTTQIDKNGDDLISKHEFKELLHIREAVISLRDVGVDVVGLVDLADFIFDDEHETLSFSQFMETVLQLRGSNVATVKDMVDLRKYMSAQMLNLGNMIHASNMKDSVLKESSQRWSASSMGRYKLIE